MSSRPTVDVLIPTRGDRPSLETAIASVDAVARREADLVDVRTWVLGPDEGSRDGAAAARNRAAMKGSGEYIALLDDDDRWVAPRLSRAVQLLRIRPEVALVCGDAMRTQGGLFLQNRPVPGGEGRDHPSLALDCFVCTSTVTMRRADWEAAGGMDESLPLAEDYDLWLRLTRDGRRVHVQPEVLAWYDDGDGRLSADSVAMAEATLAVLERSAEQPREDQASKAHDGLDRAWRVTEWRRRIGRLRAVMAHGMTKRGDDDAAIEQALQAVQLAPLSRVSWTALVRATLRLRI